MTLGGKEQLALLEDDREKLIVGREASVKAMLRPAFSRHETFHPRFSWLKKGFDLASKSPFGFGDNDTAFKLGVGKNMARAIRYWCLAFKIVEDRYDPVHKRRGVFPTEFGQKLLSDNGWDPYLDDEASLWLLHWNLLCAPNFATTWFFTFYCFPVLTFQTEQLVNSLAEFRDAFLPDVQIVRNSLQRDVNCLIRMYSEPERRVGFAEDGLDSPFTRLGLVTPALDSKGYSFSIGEKPNLPASIIVAACMQYAKVAAGGAQSIGVNRLLFDVGSPGMAFKINESCIVEAFESLAMDIESVTLQNSSGDLQVSYKRDPAIIATRVLEAWYSETR